MITQQAVWLQKGQLDLVYYVLAVLHAVLQARSMDPVMAALLCQDPILLKPETVQG